MAVKNQTKVVEQKDSSLLSGVLISIGALLLGLLIDRISGSAGYFPFICLITILLSVGAWLKFSKNKQIFKFFAGFVIAIALIVLSLLVANIYFFLTYSSSV